jgi:phage-related protein
MQMIDRTKKLQASFYETPAGREPVREWLRSLQAPDRATIGKDIAKVEFGWPIGMPYCRNLGARLWEVRSDISDGRIARVLFRMTRGRMVLLHGFIKKTQRTPEMDIDLARKRMKEIADE